MKEETNDSIPCALNAGEKKTFYKELLSLAVPIGLQNLLVALIGATDALMLGRLTQDSVAAVSLANQIVFVMNLFVGSVVGGGGALAASQIPEISVAHEFDKRGRNYKIVLDFTPNCNDTLPVEGGQRYDDHQGIRQSLRLQYPNPAVL